jgi:hypothetical protein
MSRTTDAEQPLTPAALRGADLSLPGYQLLAGVEAVTRHRSCLFRARANDMQHRSPVQDQKYEMSAVSSLTVRSDCSNR